MDITSKDNQTFKELLKLTDKKWRRKFGLCIIEGEKVVRDNMYKVEKVFVRPCNRGQYDKAYVLDDKLFDRVSSLENDAGVLAVARIPQAKDITAPFLVLDGIQDTGNLGTLLRSAAAFGFNTVYCLDCADVWSQKVLRGASGMTFTLNIIECRPKDFVKPEASVLIGADLQGGDISSIMQKNYGVVLGSEGKGIRDEIKKLVDGYITIPMQEGVESLNVGVAGAILMYSLNYSPSVVARSTQKESGGEQDGGHNAQ